MDSDILAGLIKINLALAGAIIAVLALRKPLRRLAGARLAYGLWLIVPLAGAAIFLPARQVTRTLVHAPAQIAPAAGATAPGPETVDWVGLATGAPAAPAVGGPSLATLLLLVWAAGAAAFLAQVLWRHYRFVRLLGGAGRPDLGPAVVGVFSPRIVLPSDFAARFTGPEQAVVLEHEAGHVRAGHVQQNALAQLVRGLSWFNPLVHLAARPLLVDQELACDEAVIARHPECRRTYAQAMLKSQFAPAAPLPLGCYWPSRADHPLKERISMLTRERPGRVQRLSGALLLTTLAAGAGLAAWAAQPPQVRIAQGAAPAPAGAVGSALGGPAQPKTATPAPAASVKAGTAAAAPVDPAKAAELTAAIEACDLYKALDLGASAPQVARILKGRGVGGPTMDPATAAWVSDPGDSEGGYALAYLSTSGLRGFVMTTLFGDYIPPGGAASLPNADEVYGASPPPPPPTPDMIALGEKVMQGITAQQAAETYLAAHPSTDGRTIDTSGAQFTRSVRAPGVVLTYTSIAPPAADGGRSMGVAHLLLPGTEKYPGLDAMRAENESQRPPGAPPQPRTKIPFPLPRSANLIAPPPPNADGTPKRC